VVGIKDNWLLGSGIGSFRRLYPQYEDQAAVTTTFVNHAHNDYLEILLETGIPGLLTLLLFLLWWAGRAVRVARMRAIFPCAWAAVIGSAALLLHSLVDYPLRTAALAAIMAALLALMAQPRIREDSDDLDLWPSRHISA
jgi:O-antigen ligase